MGRARHRRPERPRLDVLAEHLSDAEAATAKLVRRLEPVLPFSFGSQATPPHVQDHEPVSSSPLASRLDDLAGRGQDLVNQLRSVLGAVDL
jgi:hypothetical protein